MSDTNVLKEQQLYNYSKLMAALQARKWETLKLRMANLSRDIVCLLTQGRTLVRRRWNGKIAHRERSRAHHCALLSPREQQHKE
jgi:hypothetical protein